MQTNNKHVRPHGEIKILDERGFAYIPKILRKELNARKGSSLPFFIDANTALIIRENVSLEEVLKSLNVLKEDIKLRWKEKSM